MSKWIIGTLQSSLKPYSTVFSSETHGLLPKLELSTETDLGTPTAAKSDYAFRFEEGKWLSWPVWTVDDIAARYVEEQQRYPKPKLTCVFFAPTLVHF